MAISPIPWNLLQIALGNILKFQKKYWHFDVIGGLIYFVLVLSMFPQVNSYYPLFYLNIIVIYIIKLKCSSNIKCSLLMLFLFIETTETEFFLLHFVIFIYKRNYLFEGSYHGIIAIWKYL